MDRDKFIALAGKIADGTASKPEVNLFDQYYNSFQDKEWSFEELSALHTMKPNLWESIHAAIGKKEFKHQSKSRSMGLMLKIAASVTLIACAAWFIFQNRAEVQELIVTMATGNEQVTTEQGQVKQLSLSDGSVIWLNAQSSVNFPEKFTGITREISLEGEAYLEVAHDSDKPFIVRTGNISTRVLGTSFNIKAYQEDASIEVVVVEGKVMVFDVNDHDKQSVELKANQKAVFYKSNATLAQEPVDATGYNSWTEGKLIFKKTPLQEVMTALERKYGVNITYDPRMADCPVYANLQNETASDAIELIALSLGAKVKQAANNFTVNGGVCP